ncbi:MAG: methyl-accepting chemotaxis protein [Candidatus Omnitrophica bacterium]|nr:methyl-accepting chemotaxis protein [Candidatus Omnitrophota bacterium]
MGKKPIFRRKRYLIKTGFQLKYSGLIIAFMFLVAALTGYTVYYTGWLLMGEKLANVYPQGRLLAIMRTINITLLLRLIFIAPLVVFVSIILSHRIAGPLYRIEKYISAVAKGDFSEKLTLRKKDELKDLAFMINEMTEDLRARVKQLKSIVNMANLDMDKIRILLGKDIPDVNAVKGEIEDLSKSLKELDEHLSEYQLATVED